MSGRRGQSTIEVLFVVPACVVCAAVLVEAGSLVRDRMAVADAAGRGAATAVLGGDGERAVRAALPAGLRRSARIERHGDSIVVSARPRLGLLSSVADVRVSSVARVEGGPA